MANEIVTQFSFDPKDSVQKVGSVRQELRQLKEGLLAIPEDDPRYPKLFSRFAELQNHVRELGRLSKAADPHNMVKNYLRLGEAGVGAFTAIRSSAVLFGDANEDTLKKIAQVEAAMGLLQGIKAFDEGIKTAREMYTAMTLANKASKVAAIQSKVLGEAQVAQAEGTEVATGATRGFGLALKAIGIGLIIAAIAYLIDNWKELKNQFKDLLPHVDGAGKAFDRFKQIAVGVGSVVFNIVLTPIKQLISGIKTLIAVFGDVKSGHFGQIFDDIGQGVKDQVAIVKDGFNVIKHFKEGEAASAKAQGDDRRKEALKAEIDNLDDIIAIRKEKGLETFKLELKQLNDKKELYKDDEKETKKNNLEIEKLLIQHHKQLAEEAKKAAEKAAEAAKKEAERLEKIQLDHLKRQLETREKLKEEQLKEAEALLKTTAEFLQKGDELDQESDKNKLLRLTKAFNDLKAKTIAAKGDVFAIEVSYERQKNQLLKDIQDKALSETQKRYEKYVTAIEKADSQLEKNTKLSYHQKILALKASDKAIAESLRQGVINDTVATRSIELNAEAQKRIDKELADSKKKEVAAIGGALNSLSSVIAKNSAAGKAIAVGQALINTYQGATLALASAPPPLNFVEAAAITAAGLLNVKKMLSTKLGPSDTGGGGSLAISGTGGAGLAFNAPAIPQNTPTTNLSQDSINSINQNNPQQSQVVVSESDITNTQNRVSGYQQAATI